MRPIPLLLLLAALFLLLPPSSGTCQERLLLVRGDANYPPYEFLENGIPSGFNVDIMRAVAKTMGLPIKIDLGPWTEVRSQLEAGEIDALTGMYFSEERARLVSFSAPHIMVSQSIFIRKGTSRIQGMDDLPHAVILVQNGDIMHDYALTHFPEGTIIPVPTQEEALRRLSAGDGDAALLAKLQSLYLAEQLGLDNLESVESPLLVMRYCLAVPKGRDDLLAVLNEGLALIKQSGEYDAIYDTWFNVDHEHRKLEQLLVVGSVGLAVLAGLLAVSAVWSLALRRRVSLRSLELKRELEERLKAESALAENEARYRAIFERIMDGYYRADMDGRLVLLNPAAAHLLGYAEPEDLVGKDVATSFYHDPERRKEFLEDLSKSGELHSYPVTLKTRDGRPLEAETNTRIIRAPDTGEPLGVEGIFRDVTTRNRMNELMVQTEKMASMGGLAAGMAHEINNPLHAILTATQNVRRRLGKDHPVNREVAQRIGCDLDLLASYCDERGITAALESIHDSGRRATAIVASMLDFSRSSGATRQEHDVEGIVERALDLAEREFRSPGYCGFESMRLERRYESDLPPVLCTYGELVQVFLNLLGNASQAMAEGCTEERATLGITIARQDQGMVRVSISDNGPGMSESLRRRIFDPFFTTKPPGMGTGLGLAVSYFIITRNHGGHITVDSRPGEGTTFHVDLPAAPGNQDSPPSPRQ